MTLPRTSIVAATLAFLCPIVLAMILAVLWRRMQEQRKQDKLFRLNGLDVGARDAPQWPQSLSSPSHSGAKRSIAGGGSSACSSSASSSSTGSSASLDAAERGAADKGAAGGKPLPKQLAATAVAADASAAQVAAPSCAAETR